MKIIAKFWIGIAVLAILSPLGLIVPGFFKAGSAWGEWKAGEMQSLVGYIPQGLHKLSTLWNAPMPDYVGKGCMGKGVARMSIGYMLSAIVGVAVVVLMVMGLGRLLVKKRPLP